LQESKLACVLLNTQTRKFAATARRICGADVLARLLCRLQALSATSCAFAFCR
jgi:hypothetical protein